MLIIVNGKDKHVEDNTILGGLISAQDINPEHVVAAVNDRIVMPPDYSSTPLREGDRVDLMTFVGGG
jgi:thiamine biosynthesis protein ThiS